MIVVILVVFLFTDDLPSAESHWIPVRELRLNINIQTDLSYRFRGGMIDSLNAEISLGTVANTHDAVQWLGYTYLFVRMRKNPFVYGIVFLFDRTSNWETNSSFIGISREATGDDPQLGNKRNELVTIAAQKLADTRMIIFDRQSGAFTITDLGRIAAKYYIRYTSIEIFNKEFRPKMTEADVLAMLSMSTEVSWLSTKIH